MYQKVKSKGKLSFTTVKGSTYLKFESGFLLAVVYHPFSWIELEIHYLVWFRGNSTKIMLGSPARTKFLMREGSGRKANAVGIAIDNRGHKYYGVFNLGDFKIEE